MLHTTSRILPTLRVLPSTSVLAARPPFRSIAIPRLFLTPASTRPAPRARLHSSSHTPAGTGPQPGNRMMAASGAAPHAAASASHNATPSPRPSHHAEDGTFRNPWPSYTEYGPWDFLTKALPELKRSKVYALPTSPVDAAAIATPACPLQTTWIGHATFLLQARGYNLLTDPVFSQRCSPVQFAGPARYTPPACTVPQLPPIHTVLISHNHYDHVDGGSIAALVEKEKRDIAAAAGTTRSGTSRPYTGTTYICPLRVAPLLRYFGVPAARIVELDWWQSYSEGAGVARLDEGSSPHWTGDVPRVHAVPAQHQSARTAWDRNTTLWCGYVVTAPCAAASDTPLHAYFSGDTGYRSVPRGVLPLSAEEAAVPRCPAFASVGAMYGRIHLAMLPLGAYSPRWFMSSFHASPEDAVDMHTDVRASMSVGMHWGTFPLTDEDIEEPPIRLATALEARGVDASQFLAVRPGATVTMEGALHAERDVIRPASVAPAAVVSRPAAATTASTAAASTAARVGGSVAAGTVATS